MLVRALKGKPKALNLCNKKLDKVPKIIGKLDCVLHLQLRGNKLNTLPMELSHLFQVSRLITFVNTVNKHLIIFLWGRSLIICISTFDFIFTLQYIFTSVSLWRELIRVDHCYCFQLQILNLGNNEFEELPEVLEYLTMLEKLHLFNNKLKTLAPKVLSMSKLFNIVLFKNTLTFCGIIIFLFNWRITLPRYYFSPEYFNVTISTHEIICGGKN